MSKIRLRYGDSEIEADGSDDFVRQQIERFYSTISSGSKMMPATAPLKQQLLDVSKSVKSGHVPSPAEFYKSKGKTDGISRVLIFAKYLEQYRNQSEFSRANINDLAKEAKLSKDIHGQYFSNAVKQGFLRSLDGGKYSLTLSAEDLLAAMQPEK